MKLHPGIIDEKESEATDMFCLPIVIVAITFLLVYLGQNR